MQQSVPEKVKKALSAAGVQEGSRILAAVSGGADSVCLMLALTELGFLVHVVHVEHGIRGQESLEDCAFVRQPKPPGTPYLLRKQPVCFDGMR